MYQSKNLKSNLLLLHIIIWLAYLFTLVIGAEETDRSFWIYLFSVKIPLIILFYVSLYYAYPRFLAPGRYVYLALIIIGIVLFSIFLRFILLGLCSGFEIILATGPGELNNEFWKHFRLCLGFLAVSLAVFYFNQNNSIKQHLLESEIKSLKQQINPHFLYNTLNYFYAKAMPLSPDLSRAIGIMSQLMRYSIGSTEGTGYASIEEEVKHIRYYIELQKLRFNNELKINLVERIEQPGKRLPQMLLMNFVENAFKHGELRSIEDPIEIKIYANDRLLSFSCSNKIATKPHEHSIGTGLDNTKRRLQLAYRSKHRLEIKTTESIYNVNLNIEW